MSELSESGARFDFGRVVGRTFGLIGRNFPAFAVLSIVFVGIPQFAVSFAQGWMITNSASAGLMMMIWGGFLITALAAYIQLGAVTRASVDDLSGKGVSFGAAMADGLRYFFPLLIVGILAGIGVMLGFLLLIAPGIILAVRWSVSAPVVVIEREGPTKSLGRSAELTENHRWAIFGLALLYFLFAYAVQVVATMAYSAMQGGVGAGWAGLASNPVWLGFVGVSSVIQAVVSLISAVGTAVIYFELRRVKEGVDVGELAKVFE